MTGTWGSMLTELIPLALVIALSPLSIIPGVLVLHSPRPRPTGLAFLLGWLIGLTVLGMAFVAVSGLLGGGLEHPPSWASWLRIVIGVLLIALGIYRWVTRHRSTETPGWMRSLTTVTPSRAAITAAVLTVVNPKVLFICAAAGLAIGTAGVGDFAWLAIVYFALIAGSTVALPILAYALAPDRLGAPLERLRNWMERQHGVLVAVILMIIGAMVLYKGIHAL
ncbi:GAP family protein [Mycolicibacterium thermoresistibile]